MIISIVCVLSFSRKRTDETPETGGFSDDVTAAKEDAEREKQFLYRALHLHDGRVGERCEKETDILMNSVKDSVLASRTIG